MERLFTRLNIPPPPTIPTAVGARPTDRVHGTSTAWMKEKQERDARNRALNQKKQQPRPTPPPVVVTKDNKRERDLFQSLFDADPNISSSSSEDSDNSESGASRPLKRAHTACDRDGGAHAETVKKMLEEQQVLCALQKAQKEEVAKKKAEEEDALRRRTDKRKIIAAKFFGSISEDHNAYLFELGDALMVNAMTNAHPDGSYYDEAHFARSLDTFKNGSIVQKYKVPFGDEVAFHNGDYRIEQKIFDDNAVCQYVRLSCAEGSGDTDLQFLVSRDMFGHWATKEDVRYCDMYHAPLVTQQK